ncbi:MAG: S-layer homology domain-containing protein [Clostridia bacterium]|nr:S-layer homology domain-containing protein [Clostridia bacterium]
MKKVFIIFLVLMICFISQVQAANFWDLNSKHWAYQYITSLTSSGVINGYEDLSFRPEGTITKGEFIKLVIVAALPSWIDLKDAESNFNHWASRYVWIAEKFGVLKNNTITIGNIDKPITRIEMVQIISKADLLMKGEKLQATEKIKFKDVITLNNEDLQLLKHAISKGLIKGYSDNTFRPTLNMTRAEAATMIYRFKE